MNSSIACRYPRFDSGERRLSRTADLLWFRSGRLSFVFGRFSFEGFRLACLLIPAASTAAGREPMPARRRFGRFTSSWRAVPSPDAGRLRRSNLPCRFGTNLGLPDHRSTNILDAVSLRVSGAPPREGIVSGQSGASIYLAVYRRSACSRRNKSKTLCLEIQICV
jgi:hypothetical protein